jgi:hypothetical protein
LKILAAGSGGTTAVDEFGEANALTGIQLLVQNCFSPEGIEEASEKIYLRGYNRCKYQLFGFGATYITSSFI